MYKNKQNEREILQWILLLINLLDSLGFYFIGPLSFIYRSHCYFNIGFLGKCIFSDPFLKEKRTIGDYWASTLVILLAVLHLNNQPYIILQTLVTHLVELQTVKLTLPSNHRSPRKIKINVCLVSQCNIHTVIFVMSFEGERSRWQFKSRV